MPGSEYGNIPYEVDEITDWLETWLNANIPDLVTDALDITAITEAVEDGLVEKVRPVLNPVFIQTDINYRAVTGTWAVANGADFNTLCSLNNTSGTQNDAIYIGSFYVPSEGTYTFYLLCHAVNDHGKLHIIINGSDVANIDMYNAVNNYNAYLNVSLGSLTAGLKVVVLKISDKNASSGGYQAGPYPCSINYERHIGGLKIL